MKVADDPARVRAAALDRGDGVVAASVALLSGAVYLLTLFPSVGGGGDSVKFQYLGSVLGTAHPPGYPLYVLLSYAFSHLPMGTPAYRINLMSACFASLTAALAYLIGRRLDGSRAAAAGGALAAAFGAAFWSKAVVAEVYTLNAALFAGIVLALLAWKERRGRPIYYAVALFALAIGNHLTIVFAVPALVLYAVLVDARGVLKPRVLAASALIVCAGLAQYLFIIIRTRQHAPYLEARATNLRELIDVVRAQRFSYEIASFERHDLLTNRLPLVAATVRDELTWAGALLAIIGVLVLARRHSRELVLLLGAAAGVFILTMNVDADVGGFLVPVFVALAPIVACGLDGVSQLRLRASPSGPGARARVSGSETSTSGPGPRPPRPAVGARVRHAIVPVAAVALASWMVAANFRVNDHHFRTFEARYLDAMFERFPAKTAVVSEDYAYDQLIHYKLAAEGGARGRDIRMVPREVGVVQQHRANGFTVFAWPRGAAELARQGFQFAPEPLVGVPLWQFLRETRSDWVAIVAAPSGTLREWPADAVDTLRAPRDPRDQSWRTSPSVFAVVSGTLNGAMRVGAERAVLDLREGDAIGGRPAPAVFRAEASEGRAAIAVGGREIVATSGEVAVVVLTADGRLAQAARVDPTEHLRMPFTEPNLALSRVTAAAPCMEIGNLGWQDITMPMSEGRVRVHVDNYRPFDARFEAVLFSNGSLAPALMGAAAPAAPVFSTDSLDRDAVHALLNPGRVAETPISALAYHVNVSVNDAGQQADFIVEPHGRVVRAIARATVDRDNPKRAVVCGYPLGDRLPPDGVMRADAERFFGAGWHAVEGEGASAFRWTASIDAEVIVPLDADGPMHVVVSAMPLPGSRATMTVVVNGVPGPSQLLRPGWNEYRFDLPRWRWFAGLNQVMVRSARVVRPATGPGADTRQLGIAVKSIRVER